MSRPSPPAPDTEHDADGATGDDAEFAEVMMRGVAGADATDEGGGSATRPDVPDDAAGEAGGAPDADTAAARRAEPIDGAVPEGPLRRLYRRTMRLLPVGSLVLGVAGAVVMDRGPSRGVLVAWATLGGWLALLAVHYFGRQTAVEAQPPLWRRALHFVSIMAAQNVVQLQLFFALPFFLRAMTFDAGHLFFMGGLLSLCAVSLWDPWFEAAMGYRLLSPVLPAVGSFVVLVAVLPGTGLSTTTSLWCAAFAAGAGGPLMLAAGVPPERRRAKLVVGLALGLLLPVGLFAGGARLVPAAPLRLVRAEFGTTVADKWVADPADHFDPPPRRLVCATAIGSPIGVRDRLFHRWERDGEPLARVELEIVGGRSAGYRTRSSVHTGRRPGGRYTCRVETSAGQVLGSLSATVAHATQ